MNSTLCNNCDNFMFTYIDEEKNYIIVVKDAETVYYQNKNVYINQVIK